MEATEVKVGDETRTIYSTEYGPMITDLVGIPLPWTEGSGFALKDVNATNFRYLNHFIENNRAQSVAEYDAIERKYQGIPWVNSIAADSQGNAYYSMQGAIPYVPDEQAADCNVAPARLSTRSACRSSTARAPSATGARATRRSVPGTFPPDEVPTLIRPDYVTNGNDSHWLSNPEEPLTGFDRIIGIEEAERTLRTRLGLIQVEDRLAGRGRPARQPVQPRAAPAGRARQPPVRGRAVARQRGVDVRERAGRVPARLDPARWT